MGILTSITNIFRTGELKSGDKKSPGTIGENLACKKLKKCGYEIIEKNFKTKFGEIDIIALADDTICFIEVKARTSTYHGNPEEFVTRSKQKKLWKAASIYIQGHLIEYENYRFDVVSVDLKDGSITLFTNAFEADFG